MPDTLHQRTGRNDDALVALIAEAAEPLPDLGDPAFAAAFDRFGEARVVLLGEASHGTSEFYQARAAITRRLIERHGFTVVGVEADWPDAAVLDRMLAEGDSWAFSGFDGFKARKLDWYAAVPEARPVTKTTP